MGSTAGGRLCGMILLMITTGAALFAPCPIWANSSAGQTAVFSINRDAAVAREQTDRFYAALERLLNLHGEDHALWLDNDDRRIIEKFLEKKDALTLKNCVFGRNLLGLGIGETSKDAEEALKRGATDAWGQPYSLILAGGKRAARAFEIQFAIAVNRGIPLFNRQISQKVFVFLKADLHSLFADVFKNFNGEAVLIMAREVHIIGAPGSAEPGYGEKLHPALCAADSSEATVYIGEDDPVTTIIPKSFREKVYSALGFELPNIRGRERISDECVNKEPPAVKVVHLDGCGHDLSAYYPGMRKYGATLLKGRNGKK